MSMAHHENFKLQDSLGVLTVLNFGSGTGSAHPFERAEFSITRSVPTENVVLQLKVSAASKTAPRFAIKVFKDNSHASQHVAECVSLGEFSKRLTQLANLAGSTKAVQLTAQEAFSIHSDGKLQNI